MEASFRRKDNGRMARTARGLAVERSKLCNVSPRVRTYKPAGEWNHAMLIVNGNKFTQILNGQIVVEYEKYSDEWNKLRNSGKWTDYPNWGKFDEGHIALQNPVIIRIPFLPILK